jgi:hypothetical protein
MQLVAAIEELRRNSKDVRFADLVKICECFFGEPRQRGTSHRVYRTPWRGDPRVNIQNDKGMAKPYQVRQVIKALEKLQESDG